MSIASSFEDSSRSLFFLASSRIPLSSFSSLEAIISFMRKDGRGTFAESIFSSLLRAVSSQELPEYSTSLNMSCTSSGIFEALLLFTWSMTLCCSCSLTRDNLLTTSINRSGPMNFTYSAINSCSLMLKNFSALMTSTTASHVYSSESPSNFLPSTSGNSMNSILFSDKNGISASMVNAGSRPHKSSAPAKSSRVPSGSTTLSISAGVTRILQFVGKTPAGTTSRPSSALMMVLLPESCSPAKATLRSVRVFSA